jgi:hypothetical protein
MLFDGLEDKCMLSHVVALIHHPAIIVHAPVVHQVTSFGAHHGSIIHQSKVKPAQIAQTSFGGGNIDLTIPFIIGTNVSANQNALNFTSNTYQNVLFGTGGWDGIQQISQRFGATGNTEQLATDITALSFRMPYGNQQLLPIWMADLQSLKSGTLTPTPSGITWDSNSTTGQAVGDVLYQDLQTYLSAGLGTSFNILKSAVCWNSDNLLTYNGTVGSNNLT